MHAESAGQWLQCAGSGCALASHVSPGTGCSPTALELQAWKLTLGHTDNEPQDAPGASQNLPLRSCSGSGGTGVVLSPRQARGSTGRHGREWSRALLRGTAPAKT